MSVNSDRKASLQRVIKLQQEQLEQWENKMVISNNPDEKRLCQVRIDELKELIKQSHAEIKKLGGGKQQQVISTRNDPKEETEEEDVAADMDGGKGGGGAIIAGGGGGGFPPKKNISYFILILLAIIMFLTALFLLIKHASDNTLIKIIALALALILITATYLIRNLTRSLKLAITIILLCIYTSIFFWDVVIIRSNDPKKVSDLIIIPLIITVFGSVIQVVDNKKT
jgi:hypothetical protein